MRLIGILDDEGKARAFSHFLYKNGIESRYELKDSSSFTIWVTKEEDVEAAQRWFSFFQQNPDDTRFSAPSFEMLRVPVDKQPEEEDFEEESPVEPAAQRKTPFFAPLTRLIILLCALLFFWDQVQQFKLMKALPKDAKIAIFTPLESVMLFDYPKRFALAEEFITKYPQFEGTPSLLPLEGQALYEQYKETPYWQGFYYLFVKLQEAPTLKYPNFEKIREGELWRFFSPIFMHGNLLHILFNMLWAYLLGKQIEQRIGIFRSILLILFVGIVSNTAQYLMSGPLFLGYSGVIAGFAGFIWIRQKIAPWEGYPLHRGTLIFLGIFIVGMAAFQLLLFFLQIFGVLKKAFILANTAHITGALIGMLCAKIPFFSKGKA